MRRPAFRSYLISGNAVTEPNTDLMRDLSCCGLTLPSLVKLIDHYEEFHMQKIEDYAPSGS